MKSLAKQLRAAYRLMHKANGHQYWWPGDTPFEICVGAILTQNTNWANVEKAIENLKAAGVLTPEAMFALSQKQLAELIRPSGYFNIKALRLRAFLEVLVSEFDGDLNRLFDGETSAVRQRLISIQGIGPETADSMLLYAGGHLSFVIDAYTKRIFSRHGWCDEQSTYQELQQLCENSLSEKTVSKRLDYWQDYHAQLVMIGKDYCRPKAPRCEVCPLKPLL